MSVKLEKLAAEREKARLKRNEWDAKYHEIDKRYHEQENEEIHEMVHGANLTLDELAEVLRQLKAGEPLHLPVSESPADLPDAEEYEPVYGGE